MLFSSSMHMSAIHAKIEVLVVVRNKGEPTSREATPVQTKNCSALSSAADTRLAPHSLARIKLLDHLNTSL